MTNPLVLLVADGGGETIRLRDRLTALGFRCEVASDPAASASGGSVVLLVAGPRPLPPVPSAGSAGSPLFGVPILRLGPAGGGEDEALPEGTGDEVLAARIRTWARWSLLVRGAGAGASGEDRPLEGYRAFLDRLTEELKRQERYGTPLGLVLADIDGLREINGRYGHRTGDLVIREAGAILAGAVRGSDRVYHYGGDTFSILLAHSTAESTKRAVGRLRSVVAGTILRGASEGKTRPPLLKITMSFGFVSIPELGLLRPDEIVSAAEKALAAERASGSRSPAAGGGTP